MIIRDGVIKGKLFGSNKAFATVRDGTLILDAKIPPDPIGPGSANEAEICLYRGKPTWRDYRFKCKVMYKVGGVLKIFILSDEAGQPNARVPGRPDFSHDCFMIKESFGNMIATAYHQEGEETEFGKNIPINTADWHYVEVVVEGSKIRWETNNKLIGEFLTGQLRSGGIGLYVMNAEGCFDDVKIEGANLSILPEGDLITSWGRIKY
jgi:hypothetical protein